MDDVPGQSLVSLVVVLAGLCFLLELGLTVVLVSINALSRVALHRLSGDLAPRLAFLATLREVDSGHRMATAIMRQLALLGGIALVALAGRLADWRFPGIGAVAYEYRIGEYQVTNAQYAEFLNAVGNSS